jgi:hypothetical protein
MKNIIRKSVVAASLILAIAAGSFNANAQGRPVYDRSVNRSIGITVENAIGTGYVITDQKGNVVLDGTIKSGKTFFIATGKLGKGVYRFLIGGNIFQEFIIK